MYYVLEIYHMEHIHTYTGGHQTSDTYLHKRLGIIVINLEKKKISTNCSNRKHNKCLKFVKILTVE